jgi:hypothetical protein
MFDGPDQKWNEVGYALNRGVAEPALLAIDDPGRPHPHIGDARRFLRDRLIAHADGTSHRMGTVVAVDGRHYWLGRADLEHLLNATPGALLEGGRVELPPLPADPPGLHYRVRFRDDLISVAVLHGVVYVGPAIHVSYTYM